MLSHFLSSTNFLAVGVAGLVYWLLGALWFSVLFGKTWGAELEKHGVKVQESTKGQMAAKFFQTLVLNIVVAYGAAFLVYACTITTWMTGLKVGVFAGVCFSAATLGIGYTWEGRSVKLFLIDSGYPVLGITVSTVILALWR